MGTNKMSGDNTKKNALNTISEHNPFNGVESKNSF